jgi:hypothetical protein
MVAERVQAATTRPVARTSATSIRARPVCLPGGPGKGDNMTARRKIAIVAIAIAALFGASAAAAGTGATAHASAPQTWYHG